MTTIKTRLCTSIPAILLSILLTSGVEAEGTVSCEIRMHRFVLPLSLWDRRAHLFVLTRAPGHTP